MDVCDCKCTVTFHQRCAVRQKLLVEMSIFHVLPLSLITSDWINQQINGVPQGFDISRSIRSDHISEQETSSLHWRGSPNWLWLSWAAGRFKRWKLTFWFRDDRNLTSRWTWPSQLCDCCCFCHTKAVSPFSDVMFSTTCLWHFFNLFQGIETVALTYCIGERNRIRS